MQHMQIEISWNTLWRLLVFAGIIILLYVSRQALGVLFTAIILSLGIDPAVDFFEKRGINRLIGTIVVFGLGFMTIALAVYLIVPVLAQEAGAFAIQINNTLSNLLGVGVPEAAINSLTESFSRILNIITTAEISITGAVSAALGKVVLVLSTIIIAFYLSVEKYGPERLFRVMLPRMYENQVLEVFQNFKRKIRVWLLAQLGLSIMIGALSAIGLWLLGVKYFLILGIIAAILELVPVIGPVISGVVAFLIAISQSFTLGLWVVLLFFIIQQLENNLLLPLIMRRAMRIHPVIVLIALIAGGHAAGLMGAILAVPIALLAQEIFNYLAEQKSHQMEAKLGI